MKIDKIDEIYTMKCNLEFIDSEIVTIEKIVGDEELVKDSGFIISSGDTWNKGARKEPSYTAFFDVNDVGVLKAVLNHLKSERKKKLQELKKYGFEE